MTRIFFRISIIFLGFVLIFILQKPIFIAYYSDLYNSVGFTDILSIIAHGLPMDCSMAGYLSVIPAVISIISLLVSRQKIISAVMKTYFIIVSFLISVIMIVDLGLYGYWGFRLDTTPVFYIVSSPASAMASAESWQIISAVVCVILLSILYFIFLRWLYYITPLTDLTGRSRIPVVCCGILLTALLFIPIRGGLTVSTMNLSSAYFSSNLYFNHAAINPAFSLLYSASHQSDFGSQYQSFPDDEAEEIFRTMSPVRLQFEASDTSFLKVGRPDICLIILESFSAHLMPSLGGEPVANNLDSIAREGYLFTNFYANSFRTDRALPAIMSGWPGQPSTSIMKYARKVEHLPSWPRRLRDVGYHLSYYYGGDINFTNMLAYLVSSGFTDIIRDTDFPLLQRTSKWGAHDDVLFRRAFRDMVTADDSIPRLTVIQTSSSHEPFEVPYDNPAMPTPQANAFAFTDSCMGAFIDSLRLIPRWNNTLVIIVPDHYGAWPKGLENIMDRHHIPLVFTGGALKKTHYQDSHVGSQTDIAATILGSIGLQHDEFEFSHNLLNPDSRRQAFLADPSVVTFLNDSVCVTWNCDADQIVGCTSDKTADIERVKAYLQILYSRIDDL